MKKLISFIIMMSVILTSFSVTVLPAEVQTNNKEAMELLGALEILPEEINADTSVTRGDFAVYVARMFNVNDFEESTERYYVDVPMDHYALTAINYLAKRKIISGDGASTYRPDDIITVSEACKILMEAAGYGTYAQTLGGYPIGYIMAAQNFDIIPSGMSYSMELTVSDAANLILNAMTVNYEEEISWRDYNGVTYMRGNLLAVFHNVYIAEGVVDATNGMAVYADKKKKPEIISIDKYDLENKIPEKTSDLLGSYVKAYYRSDDEGVSGDLICISENTKKTDIFTLSNEDYSRISGTSLYYFGEREEEKLYLDSGYFIVYNGSPYTGANETAFSNLGSGKIVFKDSDRSGAYDIVIIESGENYYVSSKSEENLILSDYVLTKKNIEVSDYDSVEITDENGTALDFSSVAEKSIITVYASGDKRTLKLVVSTRKISGVIQGITDDGNQKKVTVGEKEYKVEKQAEKASKAELKAGENLSYYLDYLGNIAYYEAIAPGSMVFGYLTAVSVYEGLDSYLLLRIYERNGSIKVYECIDKVIIDGDKKYSAQSALESIPEYNAVNGNVRPQVICYELNSEGKIKKIDTINPGLESADTTLTRNITFTGYGEIVYASGRLGLKSAINTASAIQIVAPSEEETSTAKESAFAIGSVVLYEEGYYTNKLETYKLRGDSVYDDIIVRRDRVATAIDSSNYIMLVEEVSKVLNKDGEEVISISGLLRGNYVSYELSPDCKMTVKNDENTKYTVSDISEGDTIRVGEANGIAGLVEMIYDYSKGKLPVYCKADVKPESNRETWYTINSSKYYWDKTQISFGYVKSKNDATVSISYHNDSIVDEMYNQLESVMVYDPDAVDCVYVGTMADIKDADLYGSDKCSRILFQTYQGAPRGVVIYK